MRALCCSYFRYCVVAFFALIVFFLFFFFCFFFFFQAEDGIRDHCVTGVQTCALPISLRTGRRRRRGAGAPRGNCVPASRRADARAAAARRVAVAARSGPEPRRVATRAPRRTAPRLPAPLPPRARSRLPAPCSRLPAPGDRPAAAYDAHRDAQRSPQDQPRQSEEPIGHGGEEADQQRADGGEHGDHTALPQILERRAATPAEQGGDGHPGEQGGERSEERRVGKESRSRWSPYQ